MHKYKMYEKVKIGDVTGIIVRKKYTKDGLLYQIKSDDKVDNYIYAKNEEIERLK